MKQEIEIPDLPEGWKVVSYRRPGARYYYLHNGKVFSDSNQVSEYLIVEKIKPRRIVLEETSELRKPIALAVTNRTDFDPASTTVICDDGTIWEMSCGFWEKLPDIPQGGGEE